MPEGRPPISSSRIATGDIARHSFAIVRRGFDSDEVRAYLQSVARSLETFEEREQELRAALAEAEERAAHPIVDEATLTASLGQHSAQILRHAHEEAARIVVHAQDGAATLLRETQSQVDELQARTEAASAERVVEVELLVANAQQEARVESQRILSEAMADGEAIIARAKDEGRALLEQVQEARRRVLADLAARRRALGIQIEQLRAARDEMAASVHGGATEGRRDTDPSGPHRRGGAGGRARHRRPVPPRHGRGAPRPGCRGRRGGETPGSGPSTADGGAEPGGDAEDENATPSVDELFARIRAGSGDTPPAGEAEAEATAEGATTGREGADAAPSVGGPEEAAGAGADPAAEEAEPTPGPDDALIAPARRAADARDGEGQPDPQALTGRRAEPPARPPPQHAVADRRRAPRFRGRAPGPVLDGGAAPSRRRPSPPVRRSPVGRRRAIVGPTRWRSRRPHWRTWS